jgi:uncharacterized protein YqjF (DUF2071 family)
LPTFSYTRFPQINVRTYVTDQGKKPGVYFFSCDASRKLIVLLAKHLAHLPYYFAKMSLQKQGNEYIFSSHRQEKSSEEAKLCVHYQPSSGFWVAKQGTLDHWLIERYCFYSCKGLNLYRAEIHHQPWQLQQVKVKTIQQQLLPKFWISDSYTLAHYSDQQKVWFWPLKKVDKYHG